MAKKSGVTSTISLKVKRTRIINGKNSILNHNHDQVTSLNHQEVNSLIKGQSRHHC